MDTNKSTATIKQEKICEPEQKSESITIKQEKICEPEQKSESIVLVCTADDAYAMPLAVTIRSALENLKGNHVLDVFIFDGGIKKANKQKILESLRSEKCKVSFLSVPESITQSIKKEVHNYIEEVPTALKHISVAAYYRLLIPELIPPQFEKVIYLDCDLVIKGDLGDLWQKDIGEYYVLAVQDVMIRDVSSSLVLFNHQEMGIRGDSKYFNSGVLVINVKKWRASKFSFQAIEFLKKNRNILNFPDQDTLNVLFAGQWGELDPRWNLLLPHALAYSSWKTSPFSEDVYNDFIQNPYIIHFSSELKPWNSRHPLLKEHFFEYVDMTAWSGWRLTFKRRVLNVLKREFRKMISKFVK